MNPGHGTLAMTFILNTSVLIDHRPGQQQAQAIPIFIQDIVSLPELNGTSCWICLTGQLGRKDVNLLD
jgi:hypothetical protein